MIMWTCHICGRPRPDDKISVYKHETPFAGIMMTENVRYCNDNPNCLKGAKTFHHIEAGAHGN